ncbi:MAG TPA: hypothetical protein VEY67_02740 [Candidatus Dormibacteraeota bacterium]|nr:hypothetical protein [Candidatus Dormibacteraeota bacterium]
MTRVIVVDRDPALAAARAAELHSAGYDVELCGGPETQPCAILGDRPCPLADRADVLVYDAWAGGDREGSRQLIGHLRDVYVDLPVVLTSVDGSVDWVETEGTARVTPLGPQPTVEQLVGAIESALADQGMAV